jgi:hypothetical protein
MATEPFKRWRGASSARKEEKSRDGRISETLGTRRLLDLMQKLTLAPDQDSNESATACTQQEN